MEIRKHKQYFMDTMMEHELAVGMIMSFDKHIISL